MNTTHTINRWFRRCPDCLATLAVDRLAAHKHPCPYCGREDTALMGRVTPDGRLHLDEAAPPCDGRCTCAAGPDCRCRCGGENHGTHLVVHYVVDQGSVVVAERAAGISERKAQQLRAQAEEFRAVVATIRSRLDARYGQVIERKATGEFLPEHLYAQWITYRHALREMGKAADLRVHKTRMRRLRELLEAIDARREGEWYA